MTTHAPKVTAHSVAHLGRRYRYECPCGTTSALMSREAAELARDRHLWESGQIEEFRRA